jgi:hypothetical protein
VQFFDSAPWTVNYDTRRTAKGDQAAVVAFPAGKSATDENMWHYIGGAGTISAPFPRAVLFLQTGG